MVNLFLKQIQKVAEQRDLTKLEALISQILEITPIPKVELAPGLEVQRIRNNYHGEIFFSESDISYRSDVWNIQDFGRCNFPNSSKFYCSLSSKYIEEIRVINVLETNKIFRSNRSIRKRQIFTSGQWFCEEPLQVAIFPFNNFARGTNTDVNSHANKYKQILSSYTPNDRYNANKILPFISHYLGRKEIYSHWDYLISAYFSEFILSKYELDGLLYPSVRADFKAYNLVLQPSAVEKLTLSKAAMFELFLNGKKAFIDNVADGEIVYRNKIFWTQIERTSDKEVNNHLR